MESSWLRFQSNSSGKGNKRSRNITTQIQIQQDDEKLCGGHAFSTDGTTWTFDLTCAYFDFDSGECDAE